MWRCVTLRFVQGTFEPSRSNHETVSPDFKAGQALRNIEREKSPQKYMYARLWVAIKKVLHVVLAGSLSFYFYLRTLLVRCSLDVKHTLRQVVGRIK